MLDFEVAREKKGINFYFKMVPLRNRSNKKIFKYGTPEPRLFFGGILGVGGFRVYRA